MAPSDLLPGQGSLNLGERTQHEYDFLAERIARHEEALDAERLRQQNGDPYRPAGRFGAFCESDLQAAVVAGLEHAELRVFLVHIIEMGPRDYHTTAAAILRTKAGRSSSSPIGRHTYQAANRKLVEAGVLELVQRGRGRAAIVRRPHPRLAVEPQRARSEGRQEPQRARSEGRQEPQRARSEGRQEPQRARSEGRQEPQRARSARGNDDGTMEISSGGDRSAPRRQPPPPWQSSTPCSCGRGMRSYKPNQNHKAPELRDLDPVCRQCHAEAQTTSTAPAAQATSATPCCAECGRTSRAVAETGDGPLIGSPQRQVCQRCRPAAAARADRIVGLRDSVGKILADPKFAPKDIEEVEL